MAAASAARTGRDRVAALAGMASVAVFAALFYLQEAVGKVALFPSAVAAFVAVLAAGVGWPLATTAGRPEEGVR
jgi:uncharacterized membrane protein YjjP (DUF1212 family)